MIGLGHAETADDRAGREPRQIFPALVLAAIGMDRINHQRGLHAHRRAIAGIDPLDLARDQPVTDIARAGAAIAFRQGRAEKAGGAHLVHDLAVEALLAKGREHARPELVLGVGAGGIADEALLRAQLIVEAEGVGPVEHRPRRGVPNGRSGFIVHMAIIPDGAQGGRK